MLGWISWIKSAEKSGHFETKKKLRLVFLLRNNGN